MAFKPNYEQQRGDRNRAKELKKKEKLLIRTQETERRRTPGEPDKDEADNSPAKK